MINLWGQAAGGAGSLSFLLPLTDSGAGAVNTVPVISGGSPTATFVRATTAWTKLSTGLWAQVAIGVARSAYLGATTAVGAYGGYFCEGQRTNLCLQSRDLSTTWTALNATLVKDQAGIDGVASSASSMTATAINGSALQTITEAATLSAFSVFIQRITGSGTVTIQQGASTLEVSASLNSSTYTRVEIDATVLNPIVGIVLGTSGDKIAVDMCQFENGGFASSPTPATTVAVTRNADVLTYPAAGNISNATFTAYAEFASSTANASWASGGVVVVGGTNSDPISVSSSTLTTYDTGLRTLATGLTPSISIQKVAVAQNGSTINGYLNGSLTNNSPQTAHAYSISPIGIGVSGSIYQLFGTIRNVRIYPTALSAAQLQAMTT